MSVVIVSAHLLLLSLTAGTALPKLFDGQWGLFYTNYVVGPVERIINNLAINNIVSLLLWGLIGLMMYALADYCIHLFLDWWHAERDIELSVQGYVIHHPLRRTFIISVLWRMSIICVAIAAFIAVQPLIQYAFSAGPRIVMGSLPLAAAARQLGVAVIIWTMLGHGFVVILRLFLMRTRLFGDPEIE